MYKWFFAWRYLHTKLIAFFGVASVMLCVAMVLVVMSVMGGFLDTIRARSRGLHSEIVLEGRTAQGFPFYKEFADLLVREHADSVRLATPAIYTYGIFRVPLTTFTQPARVLGVRLEEYVQINDFGRGLQYDRYYPGTTRLAPQRMAVAGINDAGELVLPADLEAANARWRAAENDRGEIEAFWRRPFEPALMPEALPVTGGERVFAADVTEPTYAGEERYGIIVGCDLLNERRPDGKFDRYLPRGTDIALTLMPLSPTGNPTGEPPVRVPLRYVDDSRTGIFEIDKINVYVDFDMLQHKLAMDPQPMVGGGATRARTNQLLIGLAPGVNLDDACTRIRGAWERFVEDFPEELSDADAKALHFVEVYTWEDLQRPFIAAVEKEKVLVTFLFALISVVAIVLLGCIFYMIVEKKTRDIGVLKAIGASARGTAALFIAYAAVIGVVGSILGTLIGSLFVWNINDIQDLLASVNPQLRVWSPDIYSFDRIPEVVKRGDALWIASVAVLASMVGSVIPAWIAGRVWPVQALRYE